MHICMCGRLMQLVIDIHRQRYLHPSYEYKCVHLHKPKGDEDEDAAGLNNKMMLPQEHHRPHRFAGNNSEEMRIWCLGVILDRTTIFCRCP